MIKSARFININRLIGVLLIVTAIIGFSFFVDFLLGLIGVSGDLAQLYTHPPNYTQYRRSISGFAYEFKTNSQGLRYKEIPLDKQSPDEKRILVVGDSFTEGWGVNQEEMFSSLLEARYNYPARGVYFINVGLAGAGPLEYMRMLFNVGVRYNIDGVLICLYANDIFETTEKNLAPGIRDEVKQNGSRPLLYRFYPRVYILLERYKQGRTKFQQMAGQRRDIIRVASRTARKRGVPEEVIQKWITGVPAELVDAANRGEFNASVLTIGLLKRDYFSASLDIDTTSAIKKWQNMKCILNLIVNECRSRGIKVGLIFIPCPFQYNHDFYEETNIWIRTGTNVRKNWLTGTTKFERYLEEFSKDTDVPYLDLTDEFRRAQNRYKGNINYLLDGHWTPLGHRIAADAIAKWLDEIKFL